MVKDMDKAIRENDFTLRIEEAKKQIALIDEGILDAERKVLRDKFAGDALQGALAYDSHDLTPEEYSHNAYIIADAMLIAREDKNG